MEIVFSALPWPTSGLPRCLFSQSLPFLPICLPAPLYLLPFLPPTASHLHKSQGQSVPGASPSIHFIPHLHSFFSVLIAPPSHLPLSAASPLPLSHSYLPISFPLSHSLKCLLLLHQAATRLCSHSSLRSE